MEMGLRLVSANGPNNQEGAYELGAVDWLLQNK